MKDLMSAFEERLDRKPPGAVVEIRVIKEAIAKLRKEFSCTVSAVSRDYVPGDECPDCGNRESRVVDTRRDARHPYWRRRECKACGRRWNTMEIMTNPM